MRHTFVRSFALAATVLAFSACSDASQLTGPGTSSIEGITLDARAAGRPETSAVPSDAQLLVCPATESFTASAIIGREGGTLSAGGATITLPQRAVSRPTLFRMTVPASQYVEVDIVADGKPHFNFDKRVSITLDYSRCGDDVAEQSLAAWHIDPASKALLKQMPGRKGLHERNISFGTDHLSGYALAW